MKDLVKKLLVPAVKPIISKIHALKDLYKGQDCYLIGDGVSIKWFDMSVFSDKKAIVCNFFPFHKDFDKLDAPYLSMVEPWWFYANETTPPPESKSLPNYRQEEYRKLMDQYPDKTFFVNLSNYPVIRRKNIIYTYLDFFDDRLPSNFINSRINGFEGSIRTLITMAAYMGFKHAYLIGFDYTHEPGRNLHWYEKGEGYFSPKSDYNKPFFDIAQEFIDITTITVEGGSKLVKSITYEEFTGLKPHFQENTELASMTYLNTLATWPGYEIF